MHIDSIITQNDEVFRLTYKACTQDWPGLTKRGFDDFTIGVMSILTCIIYSACYIYHYVQCT